MRDIIIHLKPFTFISILSCNLVKKLNKHSRLLFEGRISPQQEELIMTSSVKKLPVELKVADEGKDFTTIFHGIVVNYSIRTVGDSRVLKLECLSNTYLMDIDKKIRVFQNKASLYKDVLSYLNTYGNYGFIMTQGVSKNIEKLIVQYNETDFEFIKRLASHFNTSISPAHLVSGEKYYFGIPKMVKEVKLEHDYVVKREVSDDLRKNEKSLPYSIDMGNITIENESREIYDIGDIAKMGGQEFTVCEIHSELIGAELVHKYILKDKLGQYVYKYYNTKIIGSSLESSISNVGGSKVKVYIHEDGIQDSVDWFNYSTVYSSPDGTGWYCMPENGDSVRLYFPTEKEENGYIISAVHVDDEIRNSGQPDIPRSNPDNKSLKSKYGKELLFTPNSIKMTNNHGMTVLIEDGEGITISSDKKVTINAEEEINMSSMTKKIDVDGKDSITLTQQGTTIGLKDIIVLSGNKVNIE